MAQYKLGEGPYGSAYRGTISDLFEAGDLQPIRGKHRTFGLFLGQFDWEQSVQHSWQEPDTGIWAWLTDRRIERQGIETIDQVQDIRFTGDQHHLIVASSGSGKFRDVLSNMLLYDGSCETACLIIDPKGEIASIIGPMIDAPGEAAARTVILDPWDVTGTGRTDSLTLLDGIRASNPHCVKDARVLADAIIIERGTEDGHWVATSKNFLAALLLYLGLDKLEEGARTLFRLRQIITEGWKQFSDLLVYISHTDHLDGIVARAAQAMLNRDEKERRNILSTLERDTAFIEDPGLWKAIKTSSFDMNDFVLSNKRLHVVVPFDYTKEMSSWLRLTIAAFYNACLRRQLPTQLPTYLRFRHIIIDEFAGLGKLDFIVKDIAEARGVGIKYHLAVQNFSQLNILYKEAWESLVSNSFIHAFGVNEIFTSEYLSKMTGQATVVIESKGISESTSVSTSSSTGSSHSNATTSTGSSSTSGTSSSLTESTSHTLGTSTTFSSTGRAVLMPDEIRRIPDGSQLMFFRQMPVLITRRTPYYKTFQHFMPRHSLRDAIGSREISGQGLAAFGPGDLGGSKRLAAVNSSLRLPRFVPPPYRRYSFLQALLQSKILCGSILMVALLRLGGGYFINSEREADPTQF